MRLGDWFKVEAMLHDSGGADTELSKAWAHIGEHYADRHKWGKAAQYFTQVSACSGALRSTYICAKDCLWLLDAG